MAGTVSKSRGKSIKSSSRRSATVKRRQSQRNTTRSRRRKGRSSSSKMDVALSTIKEESASPVPMDISATPKSPSPVLMDIDEEYTDRPLTLDLNFKGLTISFIIIGHGGVSNVLPLKTFELPEHKPIGQINVLGMRFSGLLNLVNKAYDEDTDQYLSEHKNSESNFISHLNASFDAALQSHIRSDDEQTRLILAEFRKRTESLKRKGKDEFFGTKVNFGRKNAQKYYQGVTAKEYEAGLRHGELTTEGPLVKVYSVLRGKDELLSPGQSIKVSPTKNGATLTEIIDLAIQTVLNNEKILTVVEKPLYSEKLPVNVNVVDLTCNYTEEYPNVGFIE